MKNTIEFIGRAGAWATGALILLPLLVLATDTYWSFTASRGSNPDVAGLYWNHTTDENGNLEVEVAVVDHDDNVIETATFDENGDLDHGANLDGSTSFTAYLAEKAGESPEGTDNGFWGDSDPYNCDFNCDPSGGFGSPDDVFGGG